jgi:hypothetical protein
MTVQTEGDIQVHCEVEDAARTPERWRLGRLGCVYLSSVASSAVFSVMLSSPPARG